MSGQTKETRIFMAIKAPQSNWILGIHQAVKGAFTGRDKRRYL
jgi:hypothetical protein